MSSTLSKLRVQPFSVLNVSILQPSPSTSKATGPGPGWAPGPQPQPHSPFPSESPGRPPRRIGLGLCRRPPASTLAPPARAGREPLPPGPDLRTRTDSAQPERPSVRSDGSQMTRNEHPILRRLPIRRAGLALSRRRGPRVWPAGRNGVINVERLYCILTILR